jgi:hypothetical protein
MQTPTPFLGRDYALDWGCVAILLIFYVGMVGALRWRTKAVAMTLYTPPEGISPALAAYLYEDGQCERAFAAALISLASKDFLGIQQHQNWFILEKLQEKDSSLPAEESEILEALFYPSDIHVYKFNSLDCSWLSQTYEKFKDVLDGIADPEFISAHLLIWFAGIVYSVIALVYLFQSGSIFSQNASAASVYLLVFIALGASAFVAAVRAWPPTLRKIASYFRRDGRPARSFDVADLPPIIFTASSLLGFAFLAALTSTRFFLVLTGLFCVNVIFKDLLEAPTAAGRAMLAKLDGFREFLVRADADRMNRENQPGMTPKTLEKFTSYAVALDVEHAWGEEFTQDLLELLQFDLAYSRGSGIVLPSLPSNLPGMGGNAPNEIIQLHIPRAIKHPIKHRGTPQ